LTVIADPFYSGWLKINKEWEQSQLGQNPGLNNPNLECRPSLRARRGDRAGEERPIPLDRHLTKIWPTWLKSAENIASALKDKKGNEGFVKN
jgi:hypothetical protein